jgi:hypothetical protein
VVVTELPARGKIFRPQIFSMEEEALFPMPGIFLSVSDIEVFSQV